jgi:hypothetical protein
MSKLLRGDRRRGIPRAMAIALAALALSGLVVGQAGASALGAKASGDNGTADANHVVTSTAVEPAAVEPGAVPTIAVASLPAPSSSTDIRLTVTNKSSASTIGARDIQAVIVDCFGALNGDALTIDDVFSVTPPPGGSASVNVGSGSTVGPAVLTFTGFNNGESSAFNLDPDTWNDPAFGATRLQMGGCRIEVVFVRLGAETPLRASGLLVHKASDQMVANLKQVNP